MTGLIISGVFLFSFLELGRKSLGQGSRGRKCTPGRKHHKVLATTWKSRQRAGPEYCNIVPETLISLGTFWSLFVSSSKVSQRKELLHC